MDSPNNSPNPTPRHNAATQNHLDDFRATMLTSQKDFVFACGGSLSCDTITADDSEGIKTGPVTIRWDPRDDSTPASKCKLTFPVTNQEAMSALIAAMDGATFGLGKQDVYDETYRKALKLDNTQFATTFCPYTAGIMDIISPILVPGVPGATDGTSTARAELYKLNIYQAPSGHFRSHVDTPRSSHQFGSLVVCLPSAHSGGELVIRHNNRTMTFDWGAGDTTKIQWAAFYSDCEHEVLQVKSGHRVTLTYNLYCIPPPTTIESLTAPEQVLDFPLRTKVKSLLSDKDFMPQGGHLGFYTSHAYQHTSAGFKPLLDLPIPPPLKGIDRALWQTFQSMEGCSVKLRPILDFNDWWTRQYNDEDRVPVIGQNLAFRSMDGQIEGSYDMKYVFDQWKKEEEVDFTEVEWLNEPDERTKEVQLAYTVYGNEANTAHQYSYCAILISIPAWDEPTGTRAKVQVENETEEETSEEEEEDDSDYW